MSTDQQQAGKIILAWWGQAVNSGTSAARQNRTQYHRASKASDALAIEATHALHADLGKQLGMDLSQGDGPLRLAMVVAIVGDIERNLASSLPRRFGEKQDGRPLLSKNRMQRIMRAPDDWEFVTRLRVGLRAVKHAANVASLGADLLYWDDDIRARWLFEYFGAEVPDRLMPHRAAAAT